MMPTLETAFRTAVADAIDGLVNTGSGTATLVFETSGDAEVATISLANPAFGAASAGVITLAGVPLQDTDAAGGTIAQGSLFDRDGTKLLEGTAGVGSGEFQLSSLVLAATETMTLTSLTITVPAS